MLTAQEINQFTGTENYYRHQLSGMKYTDGVQYLAEKAGAYWLLDAIFSYRRREPFQAWRLNVDVTERENGALLTMRKDSDAPVKVRQAIEYTDFPMPMVELWLIDGVLILPSEY